MSASSKKRLRREQEADRMTEQQLSAQKEAKKLNLYTTIFVVVLAVLLVVAIGVGIGQTLSNSGVRERKTTAMMVGEHEISNAELNYFYMDAVNQFYSQYGSYAALFGMDPTKPLNQQILDEETGRTWADDFLDSAKENATAVYALVDAANAEGFTLSEEDKTAIENNINMMGAYAKLYGYSNTKEYLKAMYGKGATIESFQTYGEMSALANAFIADHAKNLSYTDEDLRAVDSENFEAYSSYTFNTYYLAASRFLAGGVEDEEGNVTYTDEQKEISVTAAASAAEELAAGEYATAADFDAAIAALDVNKDTEKAASTPNVDILSTKINEMYIDWLTDSSRQEGDLKVFPNVSTSTDEEGNEVETINGYYVARFVSSNDNIFNLANVRHILVKYEGGSKDEATGKTVYSDEEKAAAKTAAEEILAQWQEGEATEDSFAALANEKSADGDGTTGGLYENVYPGMMVTPFNDWCFESSRKAGDTGIVETEFGYHVMFYAGDSNYTYRDYMIESKLRNEDTSAWNEEILSNAVVSDGDTSYIRMDLILAAK